MEKVPGWSLGIRKDFSHGQVNAIMFLEWKKKNFKFEV